MYGRSPIRAEIEELLGMETKKRRGAGSDTIARGVTHGEVYNWLFRHRREILGVIAKRGGVPTWVPYLERMEKEGVKRPSGIPPDLRNIANRWCLVIADIKKDAEKKAAGPPKRPRCYKKNVEPPSRPPPPDTGIRYPSWMTEEDPGFRRRYPETYGTPESPTASPPPSTQGAPIHPKMTPEAAERLAAVIREMEALDGFQPISRKRGRII